MQFELPIVTTDWRAIPSIVSNEKEGFIVPINNYEILAKKLIYLFNNPVERQKMGKNARLKYLSNYTLEQFYFNMINCIKSI